MPPSQRLDDPAISLFWFAAALVPMVASQLVRLHQSDPAAWIACDYAGRVGALLVLFTVPAARRVAFRWRPLRIDGIEAALWIVLLVLVDRLAGNWLRDFVNTMLPGTHLARYPTPGGSLYAFDIVIGLALVAFSEEVLFRRCARHLFTRILGHGTAMIIATALLFAAYHWWSGLGNIAAALFFGILAMLFYRRSGALWPLVVAHDLDDVLAFL